MHVKSLAAPHGSIGIYVLKTYFVKNHSRTEAGTPVSFSLQKQCLIRDQQICSFSVRKKNSSKIYVMSTMSDFLSVTSEVQMITLNSRQAFEPSEAHLQSMVILPVCVLK
jgi:hypothetical protein